MKIKEYQSGGIVYTPFISSRGAATQTTTSSTKSDDSKSTSKDKDKAGDAIQKEIMSVLKENGLQNDVNKFLTEANSFLNKSRNLSNVSLFGGKDNSYTMSHLIGILQLANSVKSNKGQYDTATTNLKAEHAQNEVALTSGGELYVMDAENKLSTISANEFYENSDKYTPLTNSQVL
jgi:hypothetical protein